MTTRLNPITTPRFEARAEKARRNKKAALAALTDKKAEIDAMLARLQALSDDHFNAHPDEINWADVGTLDHYVSLLKRITDSAFGEREHAE
jgi:ribosomal protein S18